MNILKCLQTYFKQQTNRSDDNHLVRKRLLLNVIARHNFYAIIISVMNLLFSYLPVKYFEFAFPTHPVISILMRIKAFS